LSLRDNYVRNAERGRITPKNAEKGRIIGIWIECHRNGHVRNRDRCPECSSNSSKKAALQNANKINRFRVLELSRRKTGQNHRRSKGGGRWKAFGMAGRVSGRLNGFKRKFAFRNDLNPALARRSRAIHHKMPGASFCCRPQGLVIFWYHVIFSLAATSRPAQNGRDGCVGPM